MMRNVRNDNNNNDNGLEQRFKPQLYKRTEVAKKVAIFL